MNDAAFSEDEVVEVAIDLYLEKSESLERGCIPIDEFLHDPKVKSLLDSKPESVTKKVSDAIKRQMLGYDAIDQASTTLRTIAIKDKDDSALTYGEKIRVSDTYVVEESLAGGGQGVVYQIYNSELRARASAKILEGGMSENYGALAAAQLSHPGIPVVIGSGATDSDHSVYLMKLIDGVDLEDILSKPSKSIFEEIRHFILVCNTAHYAHESSAIHCDIKPRNIRIGKHSGEVVLLDWDTAVTTNKFKFVAPDRYFSKGTVGYASPELSSASGSAPSRAVDIYSLGAVLFHILTRYPSSGLREQDYLALQHVTRRCKPLASICLKAMSDDPQDRFDTADEMAKETQRWLENREVRCHKYSPIERFWSAVKHPSMTFSLVASLIAGLFVLLLVFVVSTRNQSIRVAKLSEDRLRASALLTSDFIASRFKDRFRFLDSLAKEMMQAETLSSALQANVTGSAEERNELLAASDLQKWIAQKAKMPNMPKAASIFVLNSKGDQLAKYQQEQSDFVLGKNFSTRPYFSNEAGTIIDSYKVSPAYRSSSTGKIRIAFSIPLKLGEKTIGVLAMSANVRGNMRFAPPWLPDADSVAVVDTRSSAKNLGGKKGVFLVHKDYEKSIKDGISEGRIELVTASSDDLRSFDDIAERRLNQRRESMKVTPLGNIRKGFVDPKSTIKYSYAYEPIIIELNGVLVDTRLVAIVQTPAD